MLTLPTSVQSIVQGAVSAAALLRTRRIIVHMHAARRALCSACPGMHACAARAGPDGELPEALAKVDPQTLELVCAEILDRRSSVRAHAS